MESMVRADRLAIRVEGQPVLQDIGLEIRKGSITVIVGESGSGKTTLLKAIQGVLGKEYHVSGSLQLEGDELVQDGRIAPYDRVAHRISTIFQNPLEYMNPLRKIGKQFHDVYEGNGIPYEEEALVALLEQVQLKDPKGLLQSYVHELSGGMAQRVAIAMALSVEPTLLLGDEPTSALDVITQEEILRTLCGLQREKGFTLVVVTHNMKVARYMADYVVVMHEGRIVEQGPAGEVLTNPCESYTQNLLKGVQL